MYIDKLVIEYMSGLCPVQANGTLDDKYNWYFRARGDRWEFYLEPLGTDPLAHMFEGECTFYYREPYGEEGGFEAGYMPFEEAAKFIWRSCVAFLKKEKV